MSITVVGLVLRASDKHLTARFYSELGLIAKEHEHGGPKHYEVSPLSEDCVVEVYQASTTFPKDALMIKVVSIDLALQVAERFNIKPRTELRESKEMRFIYITDPDGRDVMLIEEKPLLDPIIVVNLRELRELVGMTQAELATKLGCKQAAVSKLERRRNIHLSTLRNFVLALDGELGISVRVGKKVVALLNTEGDVK